jgi:uncharacterized protein (TIGR03118 family)
MLLAGCGGGGGYSGTSSPPASASTASAYAASYLVSDISGTMFRGAHTDPHLIDAWGVAFNPQAFVWVTDNGTSESTLYDGDGVPQSLVVAIPPGSAGSAKPTGIIFSNRPSSFKIAQTGVAAAPSIFLFVGQAGTLSGWSPTVNATNAVTVVDRGASGAVYAGLTMANRGGSDFLYATDFHHASVDVFDANFANASVAGAFVDADLPAGYAPYGIQAIGDLIYVAYARQDAAARDAVTGAGAGAVDAFDTAGHLVRRLIPPGGALDAPWGIALAPANFGSLSNALLVANSGDGKVNAFDPTTGAFVASLSAADGSPIVIDGLHGIAFGNDRNNQPSNTLFFAAGPGGGIHGAYGRIDNR